ncbi:MAG: hypothetical protein LQ344_002008 [Seirophora lacunosa]|nr:MAG: hypothetical protein LQ344_002008 [Seirophora lacunosa]
MPLRLIAWVDLLGFVSFLVFLIINGNLPGCFASMGPFLRLSKYTLLDLKMLIPYLPGIVGSKQRDSGLVAQFVLPYPFGNLHLNAQVCPDCHRDWESHGGTAGNRKDETYALLHDGEDNVSRGGTGSKITDGETTARTQRPQEDV